MNMRLIFERVMQLIVTAFDSGTYEVREWEEDTRVVATVGAEVRSSSPARPVWVGAAPYPTNSSKYRQHPPLPPPPGV
jgi:hypothetical protein